MCEWAGLTTLRHRHRRSIWEMDTQNKLRHVCIVTQVCGLRLPAGLSRLLLRYAHREMAIPVNARDRHPDNSGKGIQISAWTVRERRPYVKD